MDILRQAPVTGFMGPVIATFILGFTSILLLLWYSYRKQNYWKKRGVPFVKPRLLFGSMLDLMKRIKEVALPLLFFAKSDCARSYFHLPFHEIELERYQKYGRIYGYFEGNRPFLSVADVEILRNILVKDFQTFSGRREFDIGEEIFEKMLSVAKREDWKRIRTIVTPTFTTGKIKRMIGIFKECSKTLVNNFKTAVEKGEPIEAKSLFGAFSMDIIASSAFSTKIDSHNDPNNKFVVSARDFLRTGVNWRFILVLLFPKIAKYFRIKFFSRKEADFLINATLQIVEERKKTGQRRNDFLQLLMDTAKEAAEGGKLDLKDTEDDITQNYGRDESDVVFKNVVSKRSLSLNELVAQCFLFFVAGYDTTASTLSFACYLLALNPNIQEEVIQELDDILRDNNDELTYEALQSMKYLDNVISETLRMFPPAFRLERMADEDYKLGDTGITIPKGMVITIPVNAIHGDPEYFPEPEKFIPDRFLPEEREKRNPYSYIPFGAGPRNCVAMRFALMEVKVCLAYVFSNFRLKKCPQTKEPLEFHNGQGLLQPKDVFLQLEVRTDTVKTL